MTRSQPAHRIRRAAIIGTLTIVTTAGTLVASQWTVLRQGDFPGHFNDLAWSPDGSGAAAVGDDGTVLLSTNGGATWRLRDSGHATDLLAVAWPAANTLWACGERRSGWGAVGDLLRSTDAGQTWTAVVADHPGSLTSVVFVDAGHGWVGESAAELLRTTDGGATWSAVATVDTPTATLDFVNTHTGHAAGLGINFTLYRTTDGGGTWAEVYDTPSGTVVGLSFVNGSEGFLADPMTVSATMDGGLTWVEQADLGTVWLSDIDFATSAIGWVVGHRQEIGNHDALIERSDDSGRTWTPQVLSSPNSLLAVAALDSSTAVAAGTYGTVARTTNGGASWQPCFNHPANDILDLEMASASSGWAVGPPAMLQHTTDGGSTWTRVANTGDDTLEAVQRLDQDHLFACGSYTFIASTDGGSTWQERCTYMDCHALRFTDPQTGIAGTRHGIFRTTDGGFTWDFDGTGAGFGGVFDFHFVNPSLGFAAAGIERILRTTDGGASWQPAASPTGVRLRCIEALDAATVWIGGAWGTVLVPGTGAEPFFEDGFESGDTTRWSSSVS